MKKVTEVPSWEKAHQRIQLGSLYNALYVLLSHQKVFFCADDSVTLGNGYSASCTISAAKQNQFRNSSSMPLLLEEDSLKTSEEAYFANTNKVIRRHQKQSAISFVNMHEENSELNDEEIETVPGGNE